MKTANQPLTYQPFKAAGLVKPAASCLESIPTSIDGALIEDRIEANRKAIARLKAEIKHREHEQDMELLFSEQRVAAARIALALSNPIEAKIRAIESSNANLKQIIAESAIDDSLNGEDAGNASQTSPLDKTAAVGLLASWSDYDPYRAKLDHAKQEAQRRLDRRKTNGKRKGRIRRVMAEGWVSLRSIIHEVRFLESYV